MRVVLNSSSTVCARVVLNSSSILWSGDHARCVLNSRQDIARRPERARRDAVAKKAGHGRNDVRVLARIFSTLYGDHTCRHLRSFLSRGVRTHDARVASREDPLHS